MRTTAEGPDDFRIFISEDRKTISPRADLTLSMLRSSICWVNSGLSCTLTLNAWPNQWQSVAWTTPSARLFKLLRTAG